MSKKAVIVPPEKWCVQLTDYCNGRYYTLFNHFDTRQEAREYVKNAGGLIRKVTKIVYHYE